MNKYPKYKPSNIEWIGEIPEHWEVKKLRYLAKVTTGDKDTENREDGAMYPFFVRSQIIESISSYSFDGEAILTAGDGVGVCKVWHYIIGKFDFHQRVYMMYDFPNLSGKYLYYFMKENFIHDVLRISAKSTVDSLRRTMFLNFLIAFPSFSEQTKIANFLDQKTAQIDDLIAKKERLIKLLEEEKTAVINEAVTKGLPAEATAKEGINSNVKLKDSGIEWLDNTSTSLSAGIPEHWEVKKLKYVGQIVLGKMLTNDDKGNFQKRKYLRAANLGWLNVNVEDVKEMWFSEDELLKLRLKENDLLVSEGGEVGRACIWKDELRECYIQNSVHKVTLDSSNNPIYYLYQFYLYGQIGAFDSIVNRISIAHLTVDKIKGIDFISPPLIEQNQIVRYLEKETIRIDKTIETTKKLIELLKEYRTALISEAVTGKIKVFEN